jgi:hypothetical protein
MSNQNNNNAGNLIQIDAVLDQIMQPYILMLRLKRLESLGKTNYLIQLKTFKNRLLAFKI